MMRLSVLACLLLAGCASFMGIGHGLVPGQSTQSDVEAIMGPPADARQLGSGVTELWYPQMPYGNGSYAAIISPDGRFIRLEQRISEPFIAQIVPNRTTAAEVLDLVGPPYRKDPFPRMEREIWTWKIQTFPFPKALFVQLSYDDVVREVYYMDDPEIPRLGGGGHP